MWVELHEHLWTHRKTYVLSDALGIKEMYAAAHMVHLWTWALTNAPNGKLDGLSDRAIARGAGWDDDPGRFVEAALESGFLDEDRSIHDWYDYAGRLIQSRELAKSRGNRNRQLYNDYDMVKVIRERDGDLCRYCGVSVDWKDRRGSSGATYDHIDPDGPNDSSNVVVSCRACTNGKGARTPESARMSLLPPGSTVRPVENLPEPVDRPVIPVENLPARQKPVEKISTTVPNLTSPDRTSPDNEALTPSGFVAARAARPPRDEASKNKLTQTVEAIKRLEPDLKVAWVPARDGQALKTCPATADEVAEAYVAVFRGEWGDDFMRNGLSIQLICNRYTGYLASKRAPPRGRNGQTAVRADTIEQQERRYATTLNRPPTTTPTQLKGDRNGTGTRTGIRPAATAGGTTDRGAMVLPGDARGDARSTPGGGSQRTPEHRLRIE